MMHIVLENPTWVLLNEIGMKEITQKSLALTYALAITGSELTDWKAVNQAIIQRWSESGLERVKGMAWAMIQAKRKAAHARAKAWAIGLVE